METLVVQHPIVRSRLSVMRDRDSSNAEFRAALRELATLLVYEATRELEVRDTTVVTPVAETTGLIVPLTSVVLRTALQDCRRWLDNGARISVAVNLSVRGLLDPELHATVRGLLESIGVPAELLTLEITESHVMSDVARVLPLLESLHELGVKLSVDDFGTGYSSLGYLRTMRFSTIKVDRSFVQGAAKDSAESLAIIRAVVAMADALDMSTTAEGVETAEEAKLITSLGCKKIQGYYFGRPMEATEARALFRHPVQSRGAAA